jgi:hypothetical protein
MSKPIDLTGRKINNVTIIKRVSIKTPTGTFAEYVGKCECGKEVKRKSNNVLKNKIWCVSSECNIKHRASKKIGSVYGDLTIKEFIRKVDTRLYFKCLCTCGNFCEKSMDYLKTAKIPSCGCKTSQQLSHRRGIPAHNRISNTSLKSLFIRYKKGALDRGYCFSLSIEEFSIITKQNCYYCASPPSKTYPSKIYKGLKDPDRFYVYNGIDRLDPAKGYTIENSRACCSDCNYAKSDLTEEQFLDLIEKIYKNRVFIP